MAERFAHLNGAGGEPHVLREHLRDVAERARRFAEAAAPDDHRLAALATCAGWLHDLGKYRPAFQEYLFGRRAKDKTTRHSVFGAAALASRQVYSASFGVMGHHAGLPDFNDWQHSLKDPELASLTEAPGLLQLLDAERPSGPTPWDGVADWPPSRDADGSPKTSPDVELAYRILFSCLVDADFLDTEAYFTGRSRRPASLDAASASALADRLADAIGRIAGGKTEATAVDGVRAEVHAACLRAAALPPGLFSLSAPTGSGKTLASMAFALEHARQHGHRRVIVVLPFLAIIEQNARVYRQALDPDGTGLVLEHHSAVNRESDADDRTRDADNSDPQDRPRADQAAENWDAPVVVTTAVQFLESLFSRRPGRCRKLHNIARSVVILDEAHSLPFPVLDPTLGVLRGLSRGFGVTALLCSATRPTFAQARPLPSGFVEGECREVLDDDAETARALRRARLELPFLNETLSWDVLADRLMDEPKALVIVNLRKHAQTLHDALKARKAKGLFHLSSAMCPAHREAVLGKRPNPAKGTIYRALERSRCLVISTQVIEAGVDISFPVVYRAIAPLDSILQAAGRCDREGELTRIAGHPAGRVVVFQPEGDFIAPPGYYLRATQEAAILLETHADDPSRVLDDPEIFRHYHARLVASGEGADYAAKIQDQRRRLNFREVDGLFKVIDEAGRGVVVPYAEGAELIKSASSKGYITLDDRRRLQRYTIGLMPSWVDALTRRGDIKPLIRGQDDGPLLYVGGQYDPSLGLRLGELPPESFSCF